MRTLMPALCFLLCKTVGFGLLYAIWMSSGETADFFLLLFLIIMSLLRWRIPKIWVTVIIDALILLFTEQYLVFAIFSVSEIFYKLLKNEQKYWLKLRDDEAGRYYELESLQNDLAAALAQVERMTAVAERARIARDIHDNAGHEIVAAYISLQTARAILDSENADALELYDAAIERLNNGANKIREAVHNLSTVSLLGVGNLREICRRFPACEINFNAYGDTSSIPIYVWNVLESCLNEGLTNAARHSAAKYVSVDLDTTPHIARLCIENDGINVGANRPLGNGLRNLRHRAAAIGGSLSVDAGEIFRIICVVPIKENQV